MSDGHINRTFLARNDYQSGYRAGYRVASTQAFDVLQQLVAERLSQLSEADRVALTNDFRSHLAQSGLKSR